MTATTQAEREGDNLARRNAFTLAVATGLAGANATIVYATGGIIGQSLAPYATLATLPASTFMLGTMLATLPVAFAARRFGRRATFMGGNILGAWAGILGALGLYFGSFLLFCLAAAVAGTYQAVVQSYRYAAADTATAGFRPKAISWVLTGGVAAAFIGPQLVIWTKELLLPHLFLATFIAQGAVALLAIAATARFVDQRTDEAQAGEVRPLPEILRQKRLVVAIICGTIAQALMNFVMTAAPLAMVQCGHSITDAALGIQWHVVAMFAPSFYTGHLINRFGKERMIIAGMAILIGCAIVNLMGLHVMNFWIGLALLGVGWNFAFIAATAMVTECHRPSERAKVQGFNDFTIFAVTTCGSLLAGFLLATVGWATINWLLMPVTLIGMAAVAWLMLTAPSRSAAA
ncbi:MAG: MFS transporter [Beijerinckiaceae bacterium]